MACWIIVPYTRVRLSRVEIIRGQDIVIRWWLQLRQVSRFRVMVPLLQSTTAELLIAALAGALSLVTVFFPLVVLFHLVQVAHDTVFHVYTGGRVALLCSLSIAVPLEGIPLYLLGGHNGATLFHMALLHTELLGGVL